MTAVKVLVTDEVREFVSKAGKPVAFTSVYVFLPSRPFPERIEVYGRLALVAGEYQVPIVFEVRDNRLNLNLNFASAKAI